MLMATPQRAGHRVGVTSAGREIAPPHPFPIFGDKFAAPGASPVTNENPPAKHPKQGHPVEKPCGYANFST